MNDLLVYALALAAPVAALAGEADVVDVAVSCNNNSNCHFEVTVKHDDDGWDHYANRWVVLSLDGKILATRKLAHPHDNEQPFTRSLRNVKIPAGLGEVVIRAHDLVHEYGGKEIVVTLPKH